MLPYAWKFIQAKVDHHRSLSEDKLAMNRTKLKVRAKVEPAFSVIKRISGLAKVHYWRVRRTLPVSISAVDWHGLGGGKRGVGWPECRCPSIRALSDHRMPSW